jgi:hypothetical protein
VRRKRVLRIRKIGKLKGHDEATPLICGANDNDDAPVALRTENFNPETTA